MSDIKLFDPFRRKPGSSLADFSHYWITYHAEVAKQFRRIRRYVQSIRLEHKPDLLGLPLGDTWCDGCAETWHRDSSSVDSMATDEQFPALMEDETRFLDVSHPRYLLKTKERLLDETAFDPRVRGLKVMLFARKAPHLTHAEFETAWTDGAAASLGRELGATRHVVCTAIGHIEREASAEPGGGAPGAPADGYDGVRELWWPDMPALESGLGSAPEAASRLFRPETLDVPRSFALVAHERVIVP